MSLEASSRARRKAGSHLGLFVFLLVLSYGFTLVWFGELRGLGVTLYVCEADVIEQCPGLTQQKGGRANLTIRAELSSSPSQPASPCPLSASEGVACTCSHEARRWERYCYLDSGLLWREWKQEGRVFQPLFFTFLNIWMA